MKILLSSIAKNDIRLLMRVFNADKNNNDLDFLQELENCIEKISSGPVKPQEIDTLNMKNFPVSIHYIFETEEILFVTAIFKN